MANLKAIISKNVGTTLTAAYTNTSGADAALKAFNVNQIGDATTITSLTASGTDWTFQGAITALQDGNSGAGALMPYAIKLSTDTLLLLFNNFNYTSASSSTTLKAQIVKWDGTKYLAGAITTTNIPYQDPLTNGNARNLYISGVAVTPTKVCFVLRGTLYTFNISNNKVEDTFYSLNLTSTYGSSSANVLQIATVPNNTDKVVVMGGSTTITWITTAYNVTSSANPTIAGTSFTVGFACSAVSNPRSIGLHNRTTPTYMVAAFNTSTATSAQILTFTDATNTWAAASSATALSLGNSSVANGIQVIPLATDGSASFASVIFTFNSNTSQVVTSLTTSGTVVNSSPTQNFSVGTGAFASPAYFSYNLGSSKAILYGSNYLFGIDNTGAVTNLTANTTMNSGISLVLPFDSRPVYFYDNNTVDDTRLYSRTDLTETSFGSEVSTGNYVPFGEFNGKNMMWSDTAQCWFAVQGSVVYALSSTGTILAEKSLGYTLTGTSKVSGKVINVTPTGTIGIGLDTKGASANTLSSDVATNNRPCYFTYITSSSGGGLTSASALTTSIVTNITGGTRVAFYDLISYAISGVVKFVAATLTTNGTSSAQPQVLTFLPASFGTASISSTNGNNVWGGSLGSLTRNISLQFTTPVVGATSPFFRYIGTLMSNTTTSGYLAYTNPPVSAESSSGIFGLTAIDSTLDGGQKDVVSRTQSGMNAVSAYSTTGTSAYIWTNFANTEIANAAVTTTNRSCIDLAATQYAVTAAYTTGSGNASAPIYQYWLTNSTTTPSSSVTAGTSQKANINVNKTGLYSWSIFGAGVNLDAAAYGNQATTFTMSISDGTNEFFVTPDTGSAIAVDTQYRSTDVYYVPVGYSVKIKAGLPVQLDSMLEILEQ
jgi:hypothetical protein